MTKYEIWLNGLIGKYHTGRQAMDEREFCFWLKGFFDMSVSLTLTESQSAQIKAKLNEVLCPGEVKVEVPA